MFVLVEELNEKTPDVCDSIKGMGLFGDNSYDLYVTISYAFLQWVMPVV